MDTNIVPVTEVEMREFFAKVVTYVNSLSEQAKELEQVKATVETLNQRLNQLSEENERLKRSESDAWSHAQDEAQAKEVVTKERDEAQQKAAWQQETIVARDSRVAELEAQLKSTTEERDALRAENDRLKDENSHLSDILTRTKDDLSHEMQVSSDARKARDKAISDLTAIRSIINPPTPSEEEPYAGPRAVGENWS